MRIRVCKAPCEIERNLRGRKWVELEGKQSVGGTEGTPVVASGGNADCREWRRLNLISGRLVGARAEVNVDQPKSSLFLEDEGKRSVWWKGGESWVTGEGRWACSDGVGRE